jgi:hypothetical protein
VIAIRASLADYCWIEEDVPEVVRGGHLLKFESKPQMFIEFEGTMESICNRIDAETISEWCGKNIAVINGNYIAKGSVITFESTVTKSEFRYREPWGTLVKVPPEYRVTYFVDVTEMRCEE